MKYIPIILSFLLLSTSILSFGIAEKGTNIIYVDDDNINGPWGGTEEHPYRFIQDAVQTFLSGSFFY